MHGSFKLQMNLEYFSVDNQVTIIYFLLTTYIMYQACLSHWSDTKFVQWHVHGDSILLTLVVQFFLRFLYKIYCQGFITDHDKALEELFSDDAGNSRRFDAYLNEMATRIATVFASLKVSKVHILWHTHMLQSIP